MFRGGPGSGCRGMGASGACNRVVRGTANRRAALLSSEYALSCHCAWINTLYVRIVSLRHWPNQRQTNNNKNRQFKEQLTNEKTIFLGSIARKNPKILHLFRTKLSQTNEDFYLLTASERGIAVAR